VAGIPSLRAGGVPRVINIRRRDLTEQMMELKGLRGKNTSVIKHMRTRIEQEQAEFDLSGAKIHAVRSVHLKLLREVSQLGTGALKSEMAQLTAALRQGHQAGRQEAPMAETFARLREGLRKVQACAPRSSPCWRHLPPAQCRIRLFAAGPAKSPSWPLLQ
jgi:hypothetical protein